MNPRRLPGYACVFLLFFASSFVVAPPVALSEPIGQEFIPPEHWSCGALHRFETLGLVVLPSQAPFTRSDIAEFTREIRGAVDSSGKSLGARDRFDLERLEKEFASDSAADDPRTRYDKPVVCLEEKPLVFEGDLDFSLAPEKPFFDERMWVFAGSNPTARLHIGEWLTYEVRYRLTYTHEREAWEHKNKPSPRETSWNGLASLYERSYLVFRWKPVVLYWGRDYEDWGPRDDENLIVSRTAGSLDRLGGRLSFRNVRLSFFHAFLSSEDPRRTVSAHRLEFDASDFTFGLSETVLYTGRGIDPLYALPLSAFYANQFSERGDDNVIWSVDAKYRARDGVLLFGSLLIDDFQFERDEGAPDKLGFDVGARVAATGPLPFAVAATYRYVDIYTYTHRDSLMYYVTGSGDPLWGDPPLGAVEGPDADALELRADCYPWPSVTASAFVASRRTGEGNDYRIHEQGIDPSPPFPSGVVERTTIFGAGALWEFGGGSSLGVDVSHALVRNRKHIRGDDDESTFVRAFVTWDL